MAIISGKNVDLFIIQGHGGTASIRGGFLFDISENVMSLNISDGLAPIDITAIGDKTMRRLDGVADFSLNLTCFIDDLAVPTSNSDATGAPAASAYRLLRVGDRRKPFKFAAVWNNPAGTGSVAVKHDSMRILDGGLTTDAQGNFSFTVSLSSAGGDPVWGSGLAIASNGAVATGTTTVS